MSVHPEALGCPSFRRSTETMVREPGYRIKVRVGAAGGLGTPEAGFERVARTETRSAGGPSNSGARRRRRQTVCSC